MSPHPASLFPDLFYPHDYYSARQSFIENVSKHNLKLNSFLLDSTNNFYLDIAHNNLEGKTSCLIHIAGTHGVEGLLGSAIQNYIFSEQINFNDIGLVFINCLNPFGLQFGRQLTAENINLNRNFILQSDKFTGVHPTYKECYDFINPTKISKFDLLKYCSQFLYNIKRYGFSNLKQALARGQYEYPKGLFFGGTQLTKQSKILLDWFTSNLSNIPTIGCIDIHSGLGQSGYDSLLGAISKTATAGNFVNFFSNRKVELSPNDGVAYETSGGLVECLPELFCQAKVYGIVQEFGTYPILKVFRAVRAENSWYNFGKANNQALPSFANLSEIFCPANLTWRAKVLDRGLVVFREFAKFLSQN